MKAPAESAKYADTSAPIVHILWKDEYGQTQTKSKPWNRAATQGDLTDWLAEYFELVDEGYRPAGFDAPPLPFCVRLTLNGRILAESLSNPKQREGSLVGASLPLGSGLDDPLAPPAPPQEVKPNCDRSEPRAESTRFQVRDTSTAPGDTGRRSPADHGHSVA